MTPAVKRETPPPPALCERQHKDASHICRPVPDAPALLIFMDDLTNFSAMQLAGMIERRAVSPIEVVEAHLRRIEQLNPRLNAIVTIAPDVLESARAAERAVMRGGAGGALAGVPLTIKDTIETAALRTTCGTQMRAAYVPASDAPAVARLRAAGAVILGKTNTSELALDYTADNLIFGRTNNPLDAALTPGGSSGGCAAAVGARLAPASLGSDLVGSLRIPAHFCGVTSLKPTSAGIPGAGHFPPIAGPFAVAACLGPVARKIEDLALLFEVLSEAPPEAIRRGVEFDAAELRGRRVAWYTDDGITMVTDETHDAVERAAGALADAGLVVFEHRPPHVARGAELWLELFSGATQQLVRAVYAGHETAAGPAARRLLERAAETPAPSLDKYFAAWAERDRLRAELLEWMEGVALLIAPVGAVPAYPHDTRRVRVGDTEMSTFRAFSYAQTFNTFDLPAASLPAGRARAGDLPIGVQIVGRPGEERVVLAAARIIEGALAHEVERPTTLSSDDGKAL